MISVVLPVFNAEKYVYDAVMSVLEQSYSDFEIIIVNDGSTDNTLDIITNLSKKDNRIRIINQENSGPSKARNNGINEAKGDWIYFMDSDDLIEKNMFERMILMSNDMDMVISGVRKHYLDNSNEEIRSEDLTSDEDLTINSVEDMKKYLEKIIKKPVNSFFFNYPVNRIISSHIINEYKLRFPEDICYGEDFLFFCKVFQFTHKIHIMREIYYHYLLRSRSSLVSKFHEDALDIWQRWYCALTDLYSYYDLTKQCKDSLEIHGGKLLQLLLRRINYSTCELNREEKKNYIREFLEYPQKTLILKYLSTKKGLKNYIKKLLIKTGNSDLILFVFTQFGKK